MNEVVIIISPVPPPIGGMAIQAQLLVDLLPTEGQNQHAIIVPTNRVPQIWGFDFWNKPVLRTLGKSDSFIAALFGSVRKCNVIHIMACSHLYFYLVVIPSVIIGRCFNKRLIIHYHGGEADYFFRGFAKHFIGIMKFGHVIVPGHYLRRFFFNRGVLTDILPNIIEVNRFRFKTPKYRDQIKFICTRNLEPAYDIATLVKSFCIVKKELPNSSLTLVGDGSLKNQIVDMISKYGIQDSVHIAGKVDPFDMPDYLASHDIYVNSSVIDNYPISIIEAFSCGLPVVSTSAGGIPFLIEHNVNGLLSKPGDEVAIADNMIRMARNLSLGIELSKNAKKIVEQHSWHKVWPTLKSMYGW